MKKPKRDPGLKGMKTDALKFIYRGVYKAKQIIRDNWFRIKGDRRIADHMTASCGCTIGAAMLLPGGGFNLSKGIKIGIINRARTELPVMLYLSKAGRYLSEISECMTNDGHYLDSYDENETDEERQERMLEYLGGQLLARGTNPKRVVQHDVARSI